MNNKIKKISVNAIYGEDNKLHIYPIFDCFNHILNINCECEPIVENQEKELGFYFSSGIVLHKNLVYGRRNYKGGVK